MKKRIVEFIVQSLALLCGGYVFLMLISLLSWLVDTYITAQMMPLYFAVLAVLILAIAMHEAAHQEIEEDNHANETKSSH